MKKKIVFSFILGILISSVAFAAVSLSSDKVSYNDTTVKDSLDNLFDESVNGKNSITTALSNKGFNVTNDSTYSEIVNGINELPVTLSKDDNGNYGYVRNGEDVVISFNNKVTDLNILTSDEFTAFKSGSPSAFSWSSNPITITIFHTTLYTFQGGGIISNSYYDLSNIDHITFGLNQSGYRMRTRVYLVSEEGNETLISTSGSAGASPGNFYGHIDVSSYEGKYKIKIISDAYLQDSGQTIGGTVLYSFLLLT